MLFVSAKCLFCKIEQYSSNMLFCKTDIIRQKIKIADQTYKYQRKFLSMNCILNVAVITISEVTRRHF